MDIDQPSQTHEPDETTSCSSDTTSKSLSSTSPAVSLSSLIASRSPPLSIRSISSPTHYSPSISSIPQFTSSMSPPPQYVSSTSTSPPRTSSISSPTECSSTISPSRCSSTISSPEQRSTSLSLSPLSLSPKTSVGRANSSIPLDLSHSSKELPAQPKLSSYPTNKHGRSFRSIWYSNFPWLEYSIKQDAVFCYYCRHFSEGFNLSSRQQSDAFLSGYNNWKNAIAKNYGFSGHETSAAHKFACANYQQFALRTCTETTIMNVIDKSRVELIKKNRQRLVKIASTVLLCARQLISLRGNDESDLSNNRGNFIEILKWSATTDPLVNTILLDNANNASYLSPSIQNELIHLMANQIRKQIAEKIGGHVFALMADEAKDCSGHEQLSIVLRCISHETSKNNDEIDRNSMFNEYLLGLVKLNEFDSESLSIEIIKYLSFFNIDINNCIAMCFDGASVMSGRHAGVQAILRRNYMTRAIYMHCFAHNYFHSSSVTSECFKSVQQKLMIGHNISTSLKHWCDTRWDSRWSSIHALIQNYKALIISLEELESEGDERSIFGIIKILSDQLKAKTIDFCHAQFLIKSVIAKIADLRDEHAFSLIYTDVINFCQQHHIDLSSAPRQRRIKKVSSRFKDVFITSAIGQRDNLNNEDSYRTNLFYPIIDAVLIELNDRFSIHNIEILISISALCPDSENFLESESLKPFALEMKADFCSLCNEIEVLKSMLKDTNLENIVDLYHQVLPLKQAFPTIMSLIIIAMTIPISSTTCERTFSKMKLIKTTTRNTMSDKRLNDLCVLAVERDFAIDFEQLMNDFADLHKNGRILLK
ncbi:unnamed protein product [Rotaria magnacalcarata]|uniref:TTF-type domain-containing protein n=2 Tax=Rotaria magnacalcarata TaxID=392030 RepID=A0A816B1X0_9BILA|nr:unnamed protein product [Rotaria magnacalcarata]